MRVRRHWIVYVLIALVLATGIGIWSVQKTVEARADGPTVPLRTVLEVISLLKTRYVDDVDALALIAGYIETGTINGMLAEVIDDRYTRYMDVKAFEQMQIDTQGEYGGIGITVGVKDEKLTIVAPFDKTPGHAAGLRSGDRIVAIDGKSTEHMSLDEAVSHMRGPEGTALTLTIQRGDAEPFDVDIVRAVIQVPSVTRTEVFEPGRLPDQQNSIGYIRLQYFSELSERQLSEALDALEESNVAGLILDLRDNPGGTLDAAIGVAGKFLDDGPIMHIVGRNEARQSYHAFRRATYPTKPMVVLVDGFSASASEIVAGALQDRERAVLVGEKTFGKGSVQAIVPLRDGSALALTIMRYQTAGGHDIHGVGIEPDYVVEFPWPGRDEDEAGDEAEDGAHDEAEDGALGEEAGETDAGTGETDAGTGEGAARRTGESEGAEGDAPGDGDGHGADGAESADGVDAIDAMEDAIFYQTIEERVLEDDPQFQKAVEVLEELINHEVIRLREAG